MTSIRPAELEPRLVPDFSLLKPHYKKDLVSSPVSWEAEVTVWPDIINYSEDVEPGKNPLKPEADAHKSNENSIGGSAMSSLFLNVDDILWYNSFVQLSVPNNMLNMFARYQM